MQPAKDEQAAAEGRGRNVQDAHKRPPGLELKCSVSTKPARHAGSRTDILAKVTQELGSGQRAPGRHKVTL